MRTLVAIIGVLLIIFGAIWVLQGINVLPGSFMTGDIRWAIYGAIAVLAGIALIAASRKRKPRPPAAGTPSGGPTAP